MTKCPRERTWQWRWLVAGFFATLTAATCETPDPDPVPPPDATGGTGPSTGGTGPVATGGESPGPIDDCEAAERRLRELDCRSADGFPRWMTPAGTGLAVVCRARAADGDPICPKCLASIVRCSEIDLCKPTTPGVCP
jgi:hypothetical protein